MDWQDEQGRQGRQEQLNKKAGKEGFMSDGRRRQGASCRAGRFPDYRFALIFTT
ncbi:hypothetical protein GWL_08310 [Herbaspirillum sp. GW103]|nr:hypothetical protein GWL_08310 [Herbaspirillum sp. GW103]